MQYQCFLNLIPTLPNYKQSVEVLNFHKLVKAFKSFDPEMSSRFCGEQEAADASKLIR